MSDKIATPARQFRTVSLAFNVGLAVEGDDGCNPGGSTICTAGTKGCDAGLTCVGTSTSLGIVEDCAGGSDIIEIGSQSQILVDRERLQALQDELHSVIRKFATP